MKTNSLYQKIITTNFFLTRAILLKSIKDIIPNISSVKKQGGEIFIVGTFYSEDYANAVCAKYISLGLFTNALKVKIES